MGKKTVVAVFTVDTSASGDHWTKDDIASAIDEHFGPGDHNPDATVWDSLDDFHADDREGLLA